MNLIPLLIPALQQGIDHAKEVSQGLPITTIFTQSAWRAVCGAGGFHPDSCTVLGSLVEIQEGDGFSFFSMSLHTV